MEDGNKQQQYPFSFTGTGGQFFKIWIVNILLSIITLYIYSAWAKVRTKRYFYGNTVLDGSSFEYHAKPLQILLSRLVAAALLIALTFGGAINPFVPVIGAVVLFLIVPWAIWRSTKFNLRMTSYRNVRFGFDGSVWPLYFYQLLVPLLIFVIAATIGFSAHFGVNIDPGSAFVLAGSVALGVGYLFINIFIHKRLASYFLNHYLYGKSRFAGTLSFSSFLITYLLAILLGVFTFALFIAAAVFISVPEGMGVLDWIEGFGEMIDSDSDEMSAIFLVVILLGYAFTFLVGFYVAALVQARVRKHVFSQAALDQRVSFKSTISATGLWWVMFSNLLLMVFTLGLARPFTQIRMARYMANGTIAFSADKLDEFVGEKRAEVGAFGDELGDSFDMDMDVGF